MSCPICLETIDESSNDDDIYTTICKHKMHKSCLLEWCNVKEDSCPVCRGQLYYAALLTKPEFISLTVKDCKNINKLMDTDLQSPIMSLKLSDYNFIKYNDIKIPKYILSNNENGVGRMRYFRFLLNKNFQEELVNASPKHWIELNRIDNVQFEPIYKVTLNEEVINMIEELKIFDNFNSTDNYIYVDFITRFVLLYNDLNINDIDMILNKTLEKDHNGILVNSFLNLNRELLMRIRFYIHYQNIIILENLNILLTNYIYKSLSNSKEYGTAFYSLILNTKFLQMVSDIFLNIIFRKLTIIYTNRPSINMVKFNNISDNEKRFMLDLSIYFTLSLYKMDNRSDVFGIDVETLKNNKNYITHKKMMTKPKRTKNRDNITKYNDLIYGNAMMIWIDDSNALA